MHDFVSIEYEAVLVFTVELFIVMLSHTQGLPISIYFEILMDVLFIELLTMDIYKLQPEQPNEYNCSAVAEMGDCMATIDGPKTGGCAPLRPGEMSPSNTMCPGPRPTSLLSGILIHPAVCPQQTWAENWGLCPFGEGELGAHLKDLTQCGLGQGLPVCQVES